MVAPHCHTTSEAEANIRSIEHNSAGQGPGPGGKHAGPPTGIESGSQNNTEGNPQKKEGEPLG